MASEIKRRVGGLRWWVVGLIALATVINYIDRQALGVLWPDIAADLYPDEDSDSRKEIYGYITGTFIFFYAAGQALFGKIFDWIGTRLGFALSIGVWSIATALHALATGALSFAVFRSILGLAEAGAWPGAAKANAEWFPTHERAFAQGIFNSGAAIGGIIAIPMIAFMTVFLSWQMIFITVGLIGLLWLIPWFLIVKAPPKFHPNLSEAEKQYILTGQEATENEDGEEIDEYVPTTSQLLKHKQSWGVIIASAAIDPIWWLFIVWIPIYLNGVYGMDVKTIGIYGWVPYVGAMLGAWYGGLLAQRKIKIGWDVNKTRKRVITIGCLIMLPSFFLLMDPTIVASAFNLILNLIGITMDSPSAAVIIMAVILFGFQTSIGNVQTLPSDLFSKKTVGTLSLGNEEDAEKHFGLHPEGVDVTSGAHVEGEAYLSVLKQLMNMFPRAKKVITTLRGSISASHNTWSGVLYDGETLFQAPSYEITHIVDRVGGGDSFMGGLIYGFHKYPNNDQKALDFAVAASCLKHTIFGDANLATEDEVEKLMSGDASGRVSR